MTLRQPILETRAFFFLLVLVFVGKGNTIYGACDDVTSVTVNNDLVFPQAAAGDSAATVASTSGALITMTGTKNCNYTVTVPVLPINMTGAGTSISVDTFTKSSGANYKTSNNVAATDSFYVGATRAALANPQTPGNYSGAFSVIVTMGADSMIATPNATITAIASITITKVADLVFAAAASSDAATTIAAGSGANFSITGQASTAYTITLPSSVTMTTGAGSTANTQIVVNAFTSSPSSPGTLSAGGTQTLRVGATRAAIRATQTAGSYSGSFNITVNY